MITFVFDVSRRDRLSGYKKIGIDILDEPVESFALKSTAKRLSLGDVAVISQVVVESLVVVMLEIVHPHFG